REPRRHPIPPPGAPPDEPHPPATPLRIPGPQPPARRRHIVDFAAAVIDGVVERAAVADAPAILRSDDNVAPGNRFADIRNVVLVQMTADVFVHPHQRRTAARRRRPEREKHECGYVEVAGPAAVANLL